VKHRTVAIFTVIVFGAYWFATFGNATFEVQLERSYWLTPIYLCIVFGLDWYRSKELEERIKKLEGEAAERENATDPAG
jgi:hypothetical protein